MSVWQNFAGLFFNIHCTVAKHWFHVTVVDVPNDSIQCPFKNCILIYTPLPIFHITHRVYKLLKLIEFLFLMEKDLCQPSVNRVSHVDKHYVKKL